MATAKRTTTAQSRTRKPAGAAPAVAKNPQDTVESDTPLVVDSNTEMSDMERAEAEADAEDARQEIAERAEQAQTDTETRVESTDVKTTTPADEPPKITEGVYGPGGTKEDPVIPSGVKPDTVPAPGGTKVPETQTVTPEAAEAVAEAAGVDATSTAAAEAASFDNADQAKAPIERDLNVLKALADTSGLDPATPYSEGNVAAPTPRRLPILRDTYDWTREGDVGAVGRVLVDGMRVKVNGYYRFGRKGDRIVAPADVIELAVKRGTMAKESQ